MTDTWETRGKPASDVKWGLCHTVDEQWTASGWRWGRALRVQSWRINQNEFFDSLPGWFTGRSSLLWAKSNKKKKRRVEKERMVLPFKEACPQLPAWASETLSLCQRAKQLQLGNGNLRFHVLSIRKSSLLTEGFPVAVTLSLSHLWWLSTWQETCF